LIRGFWEPDFPLPLIEVAVRLDDIAPRWNLVYFVIDTGATHTSIQPADAMSVLGISIEDLDAARWNDTVASAGIGGRLAYRAILVRYAFFDEDRSLPAVFIQPAEAQLAAYTPESAELPSLLGWDVLRHFRLTIDSDEVWLEPR
jgi:hypothetical protein